MNNLHQDARDMFQNKIGSDADESASEWAAVLRQYGNALRHYENEYEVDTNPKNIFVNRLADTASDGQLSTTYRNFLKNCLDEFDSGYNDNWF